MTGGQRWTTFFADAKQDKFPGSPFEGLVFIWGGGGGMYATGHGRWSSGETGRLVSPSPYEAKASDPASGSYDILFGFGSIPDRYATTAALVSGGALATIATIATAGGAAWVMGALGVGITTTATGTIVTTLGGTIAAEAIGGAVGGAFMSGAMAYGSGADWRDIAKSSFYGGLVGGALGGVFGAARYALAGGIVLRGASPMVVNSGLPLSIRAGTGTSLTGSLTVASGNAGSVVSSELLKRFPAMLFARVRSAESIGAAAAESAAPRTLSLDILNPHFNPNAGRVLQNFTTYWSDQLAANPSLAFSSGALTFDEYLAAQSSPQVARMAYGNAVERLVANDLTDSISSQLFQHIGGPGMPDFVDLTTGWVPGGLLDITTPAGVAGKAGRWYGPGLITPTYTRPPGFTVFP